MVFKTFKIQFKIFMTFNLDSIKCGKSHGVHDVLRQTGRGK